MMSAFYVADMIVIVVYTVCCWRLKEGNLCATLPQSTEKLTLSICSLVNVALT